MLPPPEDSYRLEISEETEDDSFKNPLADFHRLQREKWNIENVLFRQRERKRETPESLR